MTSFRSSFSRTGSSCVVTIVLGAVALPAVAGDLGLYLGGSNVAVPAANPSVISGTTLYLWGDVVPGDIWERVGLDLQFSQPAVVTSVVGQFYNPSYSSGSLIRWNLGSDLNWSDQAADAYATTEMGLGDSRDTNGTIGNVYLVGEIRITTSGTTDVFLKVGGNLIVRRSGDPANDLVRFGFSDSPIHVNVAGGVSAVADATITPDPNDCNGNSIPDSQDRANCDGSAWCSDCNGNTIIDTCDIANCPQGQQACNDCNTNGIPDGCETPTEATATYTGASPGVYNSAANWSIGVIPANACRNLYNVIIPQSKTVYFDRPGYTELTGFSLQSGSTLDIDEQEKLKVIGIAALAGFIDVTGPAAEFRAQSSQSVFQANARASVTAGGFFGLGAPDAGSLAYSWTNAVSGLSLFSANGSTSLLDLSALGSFSCTSGQCCNNMFKVAAINGGVVDLSKVTTVNGETTGSWLQFRPETGGTIDLSSLRTTSGRVYYDPETPLFELPSLQSATSAWFQVESGNVISCPQLTSASGVTLEIKDGGTFSAPLLTQFVNSLVELNPTRIFTAPAFQSFNNSRVIVRQGAQRSFAASSYSWTNTGNNTTLFGADGVGSSLDMSSLTSFASTSGQCCGVLFAVLASNGGIIDLSNVTTLNGETSTAWLQVRAETGGVINLSSLTTSNGRVYYDPEVSLFALPSLTTATSAWFQVSIFNEIDLPELTSLTNGTLDIQDGGTINAPKLTSFVNSTVSLNPIRFIEAPPFTAINNSRISVSGGKSYAVAAPSYTWTNTGSSTTLLSSDGVGSLLDLSSLTSFTCNSTQCCGVIFSVVASNGGVIDLSGLSTVTGETYGSSSNASLRFEALSGGRVLFGDTALQAGRTGLLIDTVDSVMTFHNLTMISPSTLSLTNVGTIEITGNFTFNHTTESSFSAAAGVVYLNGNGAQVFEAGGEDVGIPTGSLPSNFTWGRMVIGDVGRPTTVRLQDAVDNGNRTGGKPEALYIQGFAQGEDSLRIRGGSMLVLENVKVYGIVNNLWVCINDLIPPGQNMVPYDGGFIAHSIVVNDCNGNNIDDRVDILRGTSLDCNLNTIPDECDMDPTDPDGNGQVSNDANLNGIPDECEDCNANGIADYLDIQNATSLDCNHNLVPDECESPGVDCNQNAVADACEMAPGAQGLVGTYYDNKDFTGAVRGRIDGTVDFNWGTGAPWSGFGVDTFSIRWTGYVRTGTGGSYSFHTYTDDGVRLYVKDLATPLINKWVNQNPTEWSGTISLSGNTLYAIVMEYYADTGSAQARLSWTPPGGTKAVIPAASLVPTADCNANGQPDDCDIDSAVSLDVNHNGIPDECEPDCNGNNIPDAWDIQMGTSDDCQPNGIPDECDLNPLDPDGNGATSADLNANSVPDECEADCNNNYIPDAWDISQGTSNDCNANTVPDECDINPADPDGNGQTSPDINLNSVPDECDPDCNHNGKPDDWDIAQGLADCNANMIPDVCDLDPEDPDGNGQVSVDVNANSVPDECEDCNQNGTLDYLDIALGTSEDCNGNSLPDECETTFAVSQWTGPDGGQFTAPANWSPVGVPGAEAQLVNTTAADNTCMLSGVANKKLCLVTIGATAAGHQTLQVASGTTLRSTRGFVIGAGGQLQMAGGTVDDGTVAPADIDNAGRIFGTGTIGAPIVNSGVVEGAISGPLSLSGPRFENQSSGVLRAALGARLRVEASETVQEGTIEVHPQAAMTFASALQNKAGGIIKLQGGALGTSLLTNLADASINGSGTLEADLVNAGCVTVTGSSQFMGNVANSGTLVVEDGTLVVTGSVTGEGVLAGYSAPPSMLPMQASPSGGGDGLTVLGSLSVLPGGSLMMSSSLLTVQVGGDVDVQVNSNSRYDMGSATLQLAGTSAAERKLEVMSEDVGPYLWGLDRTQARNYPIGALRLGPAAGAIRLVDQRDNDGGGQAVKEAVYVHDLVIETGTTVYTNGCRIYYMSLANNGSVDDPTRLIPIGTIPPDLDGDGDVDADDVSRLASCCLGADVPHNGTPTCAGAELDDDGDVDLDDFGLVQRCYSGTNRFAHPRCLN